LARRMSKGPGLRAGEPLCLKDRRRQGGGEASVLVRNITWAWVSGHDKKN